MGVKLEKKKHKKQKQSHMTEKEGQGVPSGAAANSSLAVGPNKAAPGAEAEAPGPSGRKWTLSVAIPGTLLDQPLSMEVAVCIAGQIARAAFSFQVDELVVYDDSPAAAMMEDASIATATITRGTALMARLLQFLDTPLHLRRNIYGEHIKLPRELQLAAALPATNPPHHARPSGAWIPYREGVVLKSEPGAGSYVDVGLDRMVYIENELPQSTRLTVHLGDEQPETSFMATYSETMIIGKVVPPSEPRERLGLYWGCSVRLALGLQRVFKNAAISHSGKYDLTIGCSPSAAPTDPGELIIPAFRHLLVVFGGGAVGTGAGAKQVAVAPQDLDEMVPKVPDWEHKLPQDVFNLYLNTTPHLGTLQLCTEDAVPIALSYLITPILKYGKR